MSFNTNEPVSANDPKLFQRGANKTTKGYDTAFSNMHIDMEENNSDLHTPESYLSMNVIPNPIATPQHTTFPTRDVKPSFIPRQYKVIVHSDNKLTGGTNGNYKVKLQEPIKDVVSARLLNCTLYDASDNYTGADSATFTKAGDYISLHIEGFDKNIGCTTGDAGLGDRITGSFAVLYFRGPNNTATENQVLYHNSFHDNHDIKYFDPPLAVMNELQVNLYDNSGNDTGSAIENTFELLIETKDKIRVYT